MSEENVTLEESASDEIEQPETQTVESESVETEGASGTSEEVTPKPETRKFAGKYATVEDLEEAYQRSNAEATRMAQQLSQFNQPKPETKTETPKFTSNQLEDFKEGRLLEVSQAQALAAKAYADGNYQEAQKFEAAAKESARQIRMIDAELRKMEIESFTGSQKKVAAEQRLQNDARQVLSQYKDQLVEGTELHTKASEILENFVAMGMQAESAIVQAQAVSLAAQALGIQSKNVAVNTRKELTKTISQALKDGVASGAGKAGKGGGAVDFMKMTDAEFKAYKAKRGWD